MDSYLDIDDFLIKTKSTIYKQEKYKMLQKEFALERFIDVRSKYQAINVEYQQKIENGKLILAQTVVDFEEHSRGLKEITLLYTYDITEQEVYCRNGVLRG